MANCCGRKLHLPVFQSAYRKVHSTETSHMMIRNDILMNMNNQEVTLLVLLDLSAAFDTIDRTLLLWRPQSRFGFTGTALDALAWLRSWLRSCLLSRFQYVVIDDSWCSPRLLPSVGPLCFLSIPVNCLALLVITYYRFIAMLMILSSTRRSNQITMLISLLEACVEDLRRWI